MFVTLRTHNLLITPANSKLIFSLVLSLERPRGLSLSLPGLKVLRLKDCMQWLKD